MCSTRSFWVLLGVFLSGTAPLPAEEEIDYGRDIRPILSDKCFACHGPDQVARQADLRLDIRESAVEYGAIVPGEPKDSLLIERIFSTDPDLMMPPTDSQKSLTESQKKLLRQWIAAGAPYEAHWAYQPLKRPSVPKVSNTAWIENPIDAFVLRRLEAKKIQPSPPADKRTLLRRLSLDLTGLPPTPAELEAFLRDDDARAYERQVDRLLDSPHYGERMAVTWLDLVRFADTVGFHGDQNQNIFPYRDYVIESFNRNKPFDQFTIEQLAGDLLPNPTTEQLIASGFNRLNMVTREGGAQPKEYLAKYMADRVRTVGTTWLGSTFGCAECHDHKYDPITTRDFYQLGAFFADIKQWGVYADYSYTPNPDLKGFDNDYPFPPEIVVESPALVRRRDRLEQQIHELAAVTLSRPERQAEYQQWRRAVSQFLGEHPDGWSVIRPTSHRCNGETYRVLDDGSVLLTDAPPAKKSPQKKAAKKAAVPGNDRTLRFALPTGRLAGLRIELLPHEEHKQQTLRGDRETTLVKLSAELASEGSPRKLAFHRADADRFQPRYSMGQPRIGVLDGWQTSPEHRTDRQVSIWQLDPPIMVDQGEELVLRLTGEGLGCVRVSISPVACLDPLSDTNCRQLAEALKTDPPAAEQLPLLQTTWLISTAADADAFARFKQLERALLECRDGKTWTLVTEAWEPQVTRVLPRGNWQDESGDVVLPGTPHFLPQLPDAEERRLTRLDLARWLVSDDNPLTARAVVNRLWKQFFGTGLSAMVDDLGAQGEAPSHPQLLDWLAVEFRDSGWDVKHVVKLMVMSNTYRQDSKIRTDLQDIDPQNRLLAAQSPRRLEAEFVRDNALFVAGLINLEIGGPSVRPYQPPGYYENLQFPDRDYVPHTDERQYRRGLYMHWQRTFLHPMLANFDAPSREECTAQRIVSNTPQEALTLLNDPTFVEAARVFATEILSENLSSDEERLEWAVARTLLREPSEAERDSLLRLLADQRTHFQSHGDEAHRLVRVGLAPVPDNIGEAELAAWTSCCRVLLNLHETITRY